MIKDSVEDAKEVIEMIWNRPEAWVRESKTKGGRFRQGRYQDDPKERGLSGNTVMRFRDAKIFPLVEEDFEGYLYIFAELYLHRQNNQPLIFGIEKAKKGKCLLEQILSLLSFQGDSNVLSSVCVVYSPFLPRVKSTESNTEESDAERVKYALSSLIEIFEQYENL